jgi:hypothetical protein
MADATALKSAERTISLLKGGDLVLVLARFVALIPPEEDRPYPGASVRLNICEQDFGFSQRIVRLEDLRLMPTATNAAA